MAEGTRGGMSKNSFGGRKRLDHLDLMKFRPANTSPEKMLYLATIQDAAHNYLFYGLGRNGTSADEFLAAYKYFFVVQSTDPSTWPTDISISDTEQEGSYTREQIQAMCFDVQFEHSGFRELISIHKYKCDLIRQRKEILAENWDQVKSYIKSINDREVTEDSLLITLTSPSPTTLFNLLYNKGSNESVTSSTA